MEAASVSSVTHIIYTLLHMRSLCLRTNAGHTGLFSPYTTLVSAEADEPLIGLVYLEGVDVPSGVTGSECSRWVA